MTIVLNFFDASPDKKAFFESREEILLINRLKFLNLKSLNLEME